ncbi:hypothetical protein [Chitinophaga sp. MM2321]|uniref:hypothetical protein n=1 Tax=Chitinophaga sp. MM2321 TaxID=3137178 RepID=UPI0032D5ADE3
MDFKTVERVVSLKSLADRACYALRRIDDQIADQDQYPMSVSGSHDMASIIKNDLSPEEQKDVLYLLRDKIDKKRLCILGEISEV